MNKKLIKLFARLVILIAIIAPVSATIAPKSQADPIQITFWYTENNTEQPGVLQLVDDFEAANPDIDVVAEQSEYFGAKAAYSQAFIAKSEPDVFRAARDWVPEFASGGMIAPLTDEFTENDLNDFLPIAIEMMTYPDENGEDQIWGFPQLVDTPAFMLNKHHFETQGIDTSEWNFSTSWTWDEFWQNIVNVNSTENGWYSLTIAGMFFGAQPYYFGNGAEMFSNNTISRETIAIDSVESRYALQVLKNLTDSDYTPRWQEQGWSSLTSLFRDEGTAAMIAQGPWELLNYLTNSPEFNPTVENAKPYANSSNLMIIQLPHDEDGNRGAPIGGHNYVVSSAISQEKYDASVKLAKFLTNYDSQLYAATEYYHVPSRISVMSASELLSSDAYPYVKGYYDAVLAAKSIPVSHYWAALETEFALKIDDYLADEISLDDCIDQTVREFYDIIPPSSSGTQTNTIPEGNISSFPIISLISVVGFVSMILIKRYSKIKP